MAIALSKEKVQAQHGLMMFYTFLILFVVNALVIMIASKMFPTQVVLGTYSISYWWALYHSVFKLTVISVFVMPFITYYEWKNSVVFSPKQWMLTYFVVNIIAVYEITRYADNLGLGVSSWVVVVLLAAALDWLQGMAMMAAGKLIKM